MIRIVVQERQRLLREGLKCVLDAEVDMEVVAAVTAATDLVAACTARRADVAVLEADVPGAPDEVAASLASLPHAVRLIGTYSVLDWDLARGASTWGLERLVPRSGGLALLLGALRSSDFQAGVSAPVGAPDRATDIPVIGDSHGLSVREAEIVGLLGRGWTTNDISTTLGISPRTVETHKQRAFTKLGATGRAHAVALAARRGLLDRPLRAAEVLS